jgi:DNA-binding XRE family transcriptional regulator
MADRTAASVRRTCWTSALDGPRLRQLRRQHGLSQEQLAD